MGSHSLVLTMVSRVLLLSLGLVLVPSPSEATFHLLFSDPMQEMRNILQPLTDGMEKLSSFSLGSLFGASSSSSSSSSSSIEALRSSGRDALIPQCNGELCSGEKDLCSARTQMSGLRQYGGNNYWFSWQDAGVNGVKWDWLSGRNYCRKRCMDLVSFETTDEYNWALSQMNGVSYFWTSGRLCDFGKGCKNQWFWSATQAELSFNDWSPTGGFGTPQPDNREGKSGGMTESCMGVLNNIYGDGVKWHDIACHHEKPIICEDQPGHIAFVLGK